MTTLEERRHQLDMTQTFKILQGHDKVEKDQWYKMAANSVVNTRQAAGSLNLVEPRANLKVRLNFFSVRVECDTHGIKMAKIPHQFKKLYKAHRRSCVEM
jgi:hypothetical protein